MTERIALPATTRCGIVSLIVTDLARSLRYYTERIGLRIHAERGATAELGAGEVLLRLTEQPGARPVQRGRSGLYHFALLVPSRPALGAILRHLAVQRTAIDGASDHLVSEALYLSDPDGHGIEIYRDRPRAEWPIENGALRMGSDPLDAQGILASAEPATEFTGMEAATTMGHVHLHVAHLQQAVTFYTELIGMDLVNIWGGQAGFVSAGGYHHHLGMNVWAGIGVPPPPVDAARLDYYELRLGSSAAVGRAAAQLEAANIAVTPIDGGVEVRDPAQNRVRLLDQA